MLKDVFGFAKLQEKTTYGVGYKITLTKNKDEAVLNKAEENADTRTNVDNIHWCIHRYPPSSPQQGILYKPILSKTPTEIRYIEPSVFMKEVKNQNLWEFETTNPENISVSVLAIVGFQQGDRQDSQSLRIDIFCSTSCKCSGIYVTEICLDVSILINHDDDECSQGSGQFKNTFTALTKNEILQTYIISDQDFRSSNVRVDDIGYRFYIFDKRKKENFTTAQAIKVELNFDGVVPEDINEYALVLINKLVSVSSDGQRHFDSI